MARDVGRKIIRVAVVSPARGFREFITGILERTDDIRPVRLSATMRTMGSDPAGIDLAILHVGTGPRDPEELRISPHMPVLFISGAYGTAEGIAGKRDGPWGWAPEGISSAELQAAVRAIYNGFTAIHASAGHGTPYPEVSGTGFISDGSIEDGTRLSEREQEILELLSEGYRNGEMATMLGISENTVKFHLRLLYSHLAVSTRAEAMREGIRRGLLVV